MGAARAGHAFRQPPARFHRVPIRPGIVVAQALQRFLSLWTVAPARVSLVLPAVPGGESHHDEVEVEQQLGLHFQLRSVLQSREDRERRTSLYYVLFSPEM